MSLVKNPSTGKVLELFGPTVEFLTPHDPQNDFCVIRGTFPADVFVPLHSHADTEDFLVIYGELEAQRPRRTCGRSRYYHQKARTVLSGNWKTTDQHPCSYDARRS